ncbi:MAG: hypothetical protein JNK15_08300 [Planctomycetes bacterium]|nr:hypothetical protein [Planctomycetota bacterium]
MPSPLRFLVTACTAALAFCAMSPGQRSGTHPSLPAHATREFAGVSTFGGGVTAVARRYRAAIGDRDVTFQPLLGKDAPRAHMLRLTTSAITRGDTVLLDARSAATPERRHDRSTATLRWPGIDERYVARPDGLKQSFVFAEPPRGRGDLEVHLALETTLTREPGAFVWHAENGPAVTLGDVVGIDARGVRCMGQLQPTPTGVKLVLPGSFVDGATYPLELDPLIGAPFQALAGADADFPDVAYDAYSDTFCVVWTQFFANGSVGVVGSVWDADTWAFGYAFGVNQTGDEDSVRVTNIAGTGLFVMVWVNYGQSGQSICGLAFEPTQAQATSVFTIDGPGPLSSPVLSGEATLFDDDCLVAWLDSSYGLIGCSVAIDQNLQVSGTPIVQLGGINAREPAISKQGGNPGMHLVTWVDRPPGLPGRVRAQVVDHDMNLVGAGVFVQNVPQDCGYPAVDGDGFKFLVAWEEQEVVNPSSADVRGRILTVGSNGVTSLSGVLDLEAQPNRIDFAADVARLGDKFGVCCMTTSGALPYDDDAWFRVVSGTGALVGPPLRLEVTPGTQYRYEHGPRLIGRCAGDAQLNVDDGLCVFADQNVSTYDSDVGLQPIEAMGNGGPITDLGGGCGPGGLASSPGPASLGNTALALELFGASPLAVPFLFLAPAGPTLPCGVCTVVQPLSVSFVPNTAGSATFPFAIPGAPALVGVAFDFQYVSFNVLYVGCPAVPGVAASNIVRVTLDY